MFMLALEACWWPSNMVPGCTQEDGGGCSMSSKSRTKSACLSAKNSLVARLLSIAVAKASSYDRLERRSLRYFRAFSRNNEALAGGAAAGVARRGNLTCACSAKYPLRKASIRSCRSCSWELSIGGISQFSRFGVVSCSYPVSGVGLNHPLPLALSSSSLMPLRSLSITYCNILSVLLGELSCLALCSKALLRRLCCRSLRLRSLICSYVSTVPLTRM